jgi:hypothetical protein
VEQNKERRVSTPVSPLSVTSLPLPAGRKLIEASSSIRTAFPSHAAFRVAAQGFAPQQVTAFAAILSGKTM